jgi:hypothetical protein
MWMRCCLAGVVLLAMSRAVVGADARAEDEPPAPKPVDLEHSLCPLHPLTDGPYDVTHAYPTCRTWTRDSKRVIIESPGPGPDGVVAKNKRHLLTIDIETGERTYLATTVHPDAEKAAGGMGFDYAPAADCLAYMGPESKSIHLVNLSNGKHGQVLAEPEGTLGGPLSLAWDGTRIAYWVMYPMTANRFFDDYVTVIFTIDVDPVACRPVGKPRIAEAYPRRKLPGWEANHRAGIHVNHPQINPKNRDHLCYSHEMLGAEPDGSVAMSRLWQTMVNEDQKRYLIRQPAGLHFTHEVIAPDGRSLIFPYMHGIGQVDFATGACRSLYYNPHCCPGHLTISPDGQWAAGDTWGRWKDAAGKEHQSIMMVHLPTRRFAHVCWFNYSHPHPIFSQDGAKVAFSFRDDAGHQQVGWIDVRDVQRRWDEVAEGVGAVASPAWRAGVKCDRAGGE